MQRRRDLVAEYAEKQTHAKVRAEEEATAGWLVRVRPGNVHNGWKLFRVGDELRLSESLALQMIHEGRVELVDEE